MSNKKTKKKYDRIEKFNNEMERINWYKSIRKLFVEKKASKALPEIEEYIRMYPNDCFGNLLYARILVVLGDVSKAREIFKELIDSEEKNMYSAMVDLGLLEKIKGNLIEAKKWLYKAINESPYDESMAKVYVAQLEYEDNNISKATKILSSIDSEYEDFAKLELSKILLRSGNNKEAKKVIHSISKTGNAHFDRKVSLQKAKIESSFDYCDYEYALLFVDEVLLGPKNKIYWNALLQKATILSKMCKYSEALQICDTVISSNSNIDINTSTNNNIIADSFLTKGKIFELKRDYKQARQNYTNALNSANNAKKPKLYFYLGMLDAHKLRNYESAIKNLEKVNSAKIYRKNALLNIIYVNIRQKDFHKALENLNILVNTKLISNNCEEYRKLRIIIDKSLNTSPTITQYNNYSERQYANYSSNEAKRHVLEHHFKNKDDFYFHEYINIDNLFEDVKRNLTEENLESVGFTDNYLIDYDNAGCDINGNIANCINVVVVPNTKDIITMYPIVKNNDKKIDDKPKVKRLSQIEKFNKRYNLK